MTMHPPALATLDAVLERITYANEETGYTIARVTPARGGGSDLLTVVGNLLGVQPGESLRLQGRWTTHPQYGRQFEVLHYTTVLPATVQGIRRYLGSGLIKGIGPKMAERIVAHFALDTLRVIEEESERLIEVSGLGPKRQARITAAWEEQRAIKEVTLFLQGVGVSTSLAVRIYKTYRDASTSVVKNEPYRLAADVWGIGFKTADKIAQAQGIPHDSPQRVKAGLQYALSEAADDGHCYLPQPDLVAQAAEILGVEASLAEGCVDELAAEAGVVREPLAGPDGPVPAVYLVPFHRAEVALANGLLRLLRAGGERLKAFQTLDWEAAFGWLKGKTGAELAPEQVEAVQLALTRKVAVLTGGPGCGKSFTVRSIVALAKAKRAKVILAAPTGRAAKRLEELAGMAASTLHRLLQLRPGGDAAFDREHPLDADLVVVDEASMLDVLLANTLVKAIAPGAHLLLVGDVDQLPSVGAGEVLRDLLESGTVPVVRLTHIFRQAQHSGVVTNAHRINAGEMPHTRGTGRLLPLRRGGRRASGRADRGRGGQPAAAHVRAGPAGRGAGALPDAPWPGGGRRAQRTAAGGAHPRPSEPARAALREPRLPRGRQGDADPQQLRQGRVQRRGGGGDGPVPRRAGAAGATGRGSRGALRLRRAGRAGARLRADGAPQPRERVPLRGRAADDERLVDAPARPALHGGDAGQAAGGAGGQPAGAVEGGAQRGSGRRHTGLAQRLRRGGAGTV
jgi:RecD/TraA family predicted helicase